MENFFKRLGWIIVIHLMFVYVNIRISLMTESLNDYIRNIAFFLSEPILIFSVGVPMMYVLMYVIFKHMPNVSRKQTAVLIVICLLCTLLSLQPIVIYYVDELITYEYSVFIFNDYWGD